MTNVYDTIPARRSGPRRTSGWVVGHSYIVYAPLLAGCTTLLYEGKPVGTPDAGAYWRVIAEHGVKALFTAPTAFRAIKRRIRRANSRSSTTCSLSTCSSRASDSTPRPSRGRVNCSGCRSSTTGGRPRPAGPICANLDGLEPMPAQAGSPTVPVPASTCGSSTSPGRPSRRRGGRDHHPNAVAAGCTVASVGGRRRFVDAYLGHTPGYYMTGDGGHFDEDGYLYVMGRVDDVINVAGHRLSTGEMEEIIAGHPDVAECAVIGVADELKGQVPRGLVGVEGRGRARPRHHRHELVQRVRDQSAPWPHCARSISSRLCRRPVRARYCESPCAPSPTASTRPSRPPSTIPRPWTPCVRCCTPSSDRHRHQKDHTMTSSEQFRAARDFLVTHRTDYDTAYADFEWPRLEHFNFALDWFDAVLTAEHPEAVALRLIEEDRSEASFTFAQLTHRSNVIASWLRSKGVGRGSRVMVLLANQVELWEVTLAVMKLGAVLIPATTQLTANDLEDRVARANASTVIARSYIAERFDDLPAAVTRVCVGDAVPGWLSYGQWADDLPPFWPDGVTEATDPLLLYFTSGTTALPKMVEHTHQSYPVGHLSTMYWIGLRPGDVHLNVSSPGWAKHAWSCVFAPWIAGATICLYNYSRFDAKQMLDVLRDAKVTTFRAAHGVADADPAGPHAVVIVAGRTGQRRRAAQSRSDRDDRSRLGTDDP